MAHSDASIEVDLDVEATLGLHEKAEGDHKAPWSTPLWSSSMPLPSECYPLNISGLVSSPNSTTVPLLPATISTPAGLTGASPSPTPLFGIVTSGLTSTPVPAQLRGYYLNITTITAGDQSNTTVTTTVTTTTTTTTTTTPSDETSIFSPEEVLTEVEAAMRVVFADLASAI